MPHRLASSATASCACFLVPTNNIVPPWAASCSTNLYASFRRVTVCCRSMIWMPLRSIKINGAILGFQRRVWCPKCTPASRSCFIEIIFAKNGSSLFDPPLFSYQRKGSHTRPLVGANLHITPTYLQLYRQLVRSRYTRAFVDQRACVF